jgi:hypothetical protein
MFHKMANPDKKTGETDLKLLTPMGHDQQRKTADNDFPTEEQEQRRK